MVDDENWNGVPLAAIGSGMYRAPENMPELTRGLPDYASRDPYELAAMRTRETVRPTTGRAGKGPELSTVMSFLPGLGTAATVGNAAAQLSPIQDTIYGVAGRAGAATKKAISGGGGTSLAEILGVGPAQAAEDPDVTDPQPKRSQEIQSAIDAANKTVERQRKTLEGLGRAVAAGRLDKREYDQRRVGPEADIARVDAKIKELDAPYQRDLTGWEERKNKSLTARNEADEARRVAAQNAELPFRQKYPETTNKIIAGGQGVTAGTALMAGLLSRGKLMPTLGSIGVGGIEGAVTANIPELLDLAGYQPMGGPGRAKTKEQFFSTDNLIKTGAEAGLHAAEGGAIALPASFVPKSMSRIGEWPGKLRSYFGKEQVPPTPPAPPGSLPPSTTPSVPLSELGKSAGPPSPGGPISPAPSSAQPTVFTRGGQTFALTPDGKVLKQSGSGWHGPDGKWIKKDDWPTLGSLGKTSP